MKGNTYFIVLALATFAYTSVTAQTPYGDTAQSIPGRIEAEDFDRGGEGKDYHDRTTKNQGLGYRPDEAPGIKGMTVPAGKPAW